MPDKQPTRQQQKIYLTPGARAKLREVADDRDCEMSDVVENLVLNEAYPTRKEL